MIIAIINNGKTYGTLNGVITKNSDIMKHVASKLKRNEAKLIVDTEETLMYHLDEKAKKANSE